MPELPEVETVRRGLEPLLVGRRIARVHVLDPRLVQPADPRDVERLLRGREIAAVSRRGKYLILECGDRDLVAVHHLRMTGSFAGPGQPEPTHVRMRYVVDGLDGEIRYNDPRRFGTLAIGTRAEITQHLDARLGPEPLDPAWDASQLHARTKGRAAPLKAVLLDQRVVAGLGNIYVDEACFLAAVRPDLSADRVSRVAAGRLVEAIRARLTEAIDVGGSTLRDYRGVEGTEGGMQERFVAYGRAGKPCLTCGTT
ncbi:MAG: bifunctional DNA-formamidopyrimidine glycosylase/DNA-(apurinic or apyrimidinic site) lyase, partial [Thermoleophilia bacterium]|nr:bifunctional DNA-formamidopyrimidine glycosylase/DNA-(apurinic or apyrimidinic site) lyase [Thermoleophilia bacterium]